VTGEALFADNGGCTGGGGFTAVVANNVFYSLGGNIYVNATTGAQLGTFAADVATAVWSPHPSCRLARYGTSTI
jgi:hypothetical protein